MTAAQRMAAMILFVFTILFKYGILLYVISFPAGNIRIIANEPLAELNGAVKNIRSAAGRFCKGWRVILEKTNRKSWQR